MISWIAQCVWFLTKAFYCAFLPQPFSNGYFLWNCRYGGFESILASHVLLSQRQDPKEKQVINLDQDVQVCGYFWWMVYGLLCMHHLSLFLSFWIRGYLFFFLLFLTCLSMWHTFFGYASFILFFGCAEACGIPSLGMHLLFSFCIAPYPWYVFERVVSYIDMELYFVDGWMFAYF